MKKELHLENFDGPLHLLLELVEAEEMPITDISLSHVTEQFLAYMQEVEKRLPEELADFLVVATRLLLLKSRVLLPFMEGEEEHPDQLAAQLRMYKKYAQATHGIEEMFNAETMLYPKKVNTQRVTNKEYIPPEGVGVEELRELYKSVLARLEPVVRIPKMAMEKVVTLREKLSQIQRLIEEHISLNFQQLIADSNDAGEVVVTFLAVLELVKKQSIMVRQEGAYTDIVVEKVE